AEAAARLTLGSSSGTSAPRLGRDALATAQSAVVSSKNKLDITRFNGANRSSTSAPPEYLPEGLSAFPRWLLQRFCRF
ncbi:MAG: hypothetical protein IJE77_12625, partial [Thermoguttaceae bacterium]|nr:hypothetical protein [Thermoguttaceae bacterium]